MSEKKRVLIICLGNICRSPIGEAVFQHLIKKDGLEDKWEVESAALIRYHLGKSPDHRAMSTLREKGITDYSHKARLITEEDFIKFDWILGMDNDNISDLNHMKPADSKAKIELLGKYDSKGEIIIRDPYFDNDSAGYAKAYEQCLRSLTSFLEQHNNE
ncbi:low molecular weight phosphotyrosine protein phosphatase-like isoform X2 [Venturia canescens]|uniref:low molecular weight phosphotyrosine protein phosphatase-like isoform X2 n=1 Tax=Venturia canescens TaxID=32260 RepID=UPI001C9C7259|nr:low molecular weight phosphotyrosine protein phosphatase-like isoform X2 [Venturia canescens]